MSPVYLAVSPGVDEGGTGTGTSPVTGETSWYPVVANPRDLQLGISVDTLSGTSPKLYAWVQGTNDHGITAFDVAAALTLKTATTTTGGTVSTNKRNLVDGDGGTGTYFASFPGFAFSEMRLKWIAEGTDVTVDMTIHGLPA